MVRSEPRKTVILFGESGHGKSSIVKMLADATNNVLAEVGNSVEGVTFKSQCYTRQIAGELYDVWDTVGLGEGEHGTVAGPEAIAALYRLMHHLKGGIHLLIFAIRGPRLSGQNKKNYDMFYKIFCEEEVPIVLLVTHTDFFGNSKGPR